MASQRAYELPVELWTEVFGWFSRAPHRSNERYSSPKDDSMATFPSLAMVCQQFRHISQPFIFSRFHFDGPNCAPEDYVGKLEEGAGRMERLLVLLQQQPDRRRWLKVLRCRFRTRIPENFPYSQGPHQMARMVRLVEQLFLQLINVRSLTLSGMPISPNLYSHICSIPTLQIVHLDDIPPPNILYNPDIPPKWQELSIRELTVLFDNRSKAAVDTKALFKLSLASQLKTLNTSLWVLARNYKRHVSVSWAFVTDLTLSVSQTTPELGWVLKAFPSLHRLSLRVTTYRPHFAPFQEECVPLLTDFSGPWRLACSVIPGRPIQKASLELENGQIPPGATMAFLSQGTARLEHLELRNIYQSRECMKHVAVLLPDLKSLSLTSSLRAAVCYIRVLVDFVASNCTMPQLNHLQFSTLRRPQRRRVRKPGDVEFSGWLQSSATAFPSLCTAKLQGDLWRRGRGDAGEWRRAYDD